MVPSLQVRRPRRYPQTYHRPRRRVLPVALLIDTRVSVTIEVVFQLAVRIAGTVLASGRYRR